MHAGCVLGEMCFSRILSWFRIGVTAIIIIIIFGVAWYSNYRHHYCNYCKYFEKPHFLFGFDYLERLFSQRPSAGLPLRNATRYNLSQNDGESHGSVHGA